MRVWPEPETAPRIVSNLNRAGNLKQNMHASNSMCVQATKIPIMVALPFNGVFRVLIRVRQGFPVAVVVQGDALPHPVGIDVTVGRSHVGFDKM